MASSSKKPSLLPALFTMKCPSCRRSTVFVNKSIFPLDKCLALKDECEICGQRMKSESNNGGGINYALTMILFFLNLLCEFGDASSMCTSYDTIHWMHPE